MSHRCLPPTLSKMNAITVQNKCRHRTALFDHKQRKGQYSTIVDHMPPAHAAMDSPWSPERFTSWARRIGPQTGLAIERVMAGRTIVERSFVPCRNILGLSKTYTPELLERACGRLNEPGALPSYTAVRNAILAIKAADRAAVPTHATPPPGGGPLEDRAKNAGRLRGADAYRRGGRAC